MPGGRIERMAVDRREAAEILRCSYPQIIRLTSDGRIPVYRVGRLVRIRLADLERFMAEGGTR